jgi:hypothetical protein
MAWPIVEHHQYLLIGVALAKFLQEHLKEQTLSARGKYRHKDSPVVGSTAAYSQLHRYLRSTIQGGLTPLGQ